MLPCCCRSYVKIGVACWAGVAGFALRSGWGFMSQQRVQPFPPFPDVAVSGWGRGYWASWGQGVALGGHGPSIMWALGKGTN